MVLDIGHSPRFHIPICMVGIFSFALQNVIWDDYGLIQRGLATSSLHLILSSLRNSHEAQW